MGADLVAAVTLTLPWPPSVNHLYYTHGRTRHLSKEGRAYHLNVQAAVLEQNVGSFIGGVRLGYELLVFPPDKRKRDLSNVIKAVEDALTKAGIWPDDSQVDRIAVHRREPVKGGRTEITITESTT